MSVYEITSEAPYAATGHEFRRGLAAVTPVTIGFVPFALVLGAQAAQKGLSILEVPLLTGSNFGGGSEFAAIGLWTSPPQIFLVVAVTLLINSRHLLMGAALAPFLRNLPKRKVLTILFWMCDESWAMSLADANKRSMTGEQAQFSLPYYLGVALPLYATWVIFTLVGSMVGPVIGDLGAYGLDMAFPAVFLVLLRSMWTDWKAARPWMVSLLVGSAVCLLIPGAWYVPAGALSGIAAAWLWAEA